VSRRHRSTSLVGRWITPWASSAAPSATANPALAGVVKNRRDALSCRDVSVSGHLGRRVPADAADQPLPGATYGDNWRLRLRRVRLASAELPLSPQSSLG